MGAPGRTDLFETPQVLTPSTGLSWSAGRVWDRHKYFITLISDVKYHGVMSPNAAQTSTKGGTAELASRLRLTVARLARRLRREDPAGLSPSLHSALAAVERHGPLTLGKLAAIEQVAPPSMTRAVGALSAAGLVERVVDPDDRRVAWIGLTGEGKALLRRSRRKRDAYLAAHLRKSTPEELAILERAAEILERLLGGQH